jgi:hypothetical protein
MPNLGNILQNSLFYLVKFIKKKFQKFSAFIFRIIFLPTLPSDYSILVLCKCGIHCIVNVCVNMEYIARLEYYVRFIGYVNIEVSYN